MPRKQPYRPGELDQRVTLQKEEFTADGMGGQTSAWVDQATVWAHVRARTGRERLHSDMLAAEGGYMVVIRNRRDLDIDASWRVLWRGKALNVRFLEDNGPRDMYLVLDCDQGVAT